MKFSFSRFFNILILSFYSKKLYQLIFTKAKSLGLAFVFFLAMILAIPVVMDTITLGQAIYKDSLFAGSGNTEDSELGQILSQMPEVKIANGVASINKEGIYTIVNPDNDEPLIVFDMEGKITDIESSAAFLMVKKEKAIYKINNQLYEFIYADQIPKSDLTINSDVIINFLKEKRNSILYTVPFFSFIYGISASFMQLIVKIGLITGFGFVYLLLFKAKGTFVDVFRIIAVAQSPVVLLKFFAGLFLYVVSFEVFSTILLATTIFYFLFAINSVKPNQKIV